MDKRSVCLDKTSAASWVGGSLDYWAVRQAPCVSVAGSVYLGRDVWAWEWRRAGWFETMFPGDSRFLRRSVCEPFWSLFGFGRWKEMCWSRHVFPLHCCIPNGNNPQTRALGSSGQSQTLVFNHRPPCMFPLEALFQENISLAEVDPEAGPGCQVDREEAEAGSRCKHICHIVIGTASGWGEWWWWQFGW